MRTLGGWASENEVMAAGFIRPSRAGTSPDEELAVTGVEGLQGRASGELADTGVQPEEPGRSQLMWAEYQPGAKGPSRTGPTATHRDAPLVPSKQRVAGSNPAGAHLSPLLDYCLS